MSQTPVDGSDREGRNVGETDRGSESTSLLGRVARRIRSVGRSLRARLRSVTEQSDEHRRFASGGRHDRPVTRERTHSIQCAGLTEEVVEGDGRVATDELVRSRAANRTDRDGPSVDRPDLVAQWSGDELTLSAPDQPGAHITSTYWEDVER